MRKNPIVCIDLRLNYNVVCNFNNSTPWNKIKNGFAWDHQNEEKNAAFIKRYQSFDQGVKKVKSDKREKDVRRWEVF